MVGFLSQNYITLHNNLVNMIVLLEYLPQAYMYVYGTNFMQASILNML
jgi:hypothetical protein